MRCVAHWTVRVASGIDAVGCFTGATVTGPGQRGARVRRRVSARATRWGRLRDSGRGEPVDLYEYQAKDLFAQHGVPVCRAGPSRRPRRPRGGPRARRDRGRQGAGEDRRPRQGRRRQARRDRRGGGGARRRTSSAWTSRATPCTRCWSPQAADIAEEYYFSFLLDRANRTYLAMASRRGRHGDRAGRRRAPRGAGQDPGRRRSTGVDAAKAARDRRRGELPGRRSADQVADVAGQAVGGLRRRGRHAGRGQPAGRRPPTAACSPSTARSPSTRTPTSATPTTRRCVDKAADRPARGRRPRRRTSTTSSSTARSASSATAPGLVMSTLDVVAYAGEEFGGVKPANFLDIGGGAIGRGDGQRPGDHARPTRR